MASNIVVLDENVANQIAAGEVIERPASVVKELVENSIDAGSNRIAVKVLDGGRTSIKILDNGQGIRKEDVELAFQRHATSKIREATDLFSIRTLGFRGEALPSIAAVSKVTIKTRHEDEKTGTLLRIEGGEVKQKKEIGRAVGTEIEVEDLFYNTPARYKYLKTKSTELSRISDFFNRIAVSESQIAMTLTHNKKLVNRTPGTGRVKDAILSIYGREMVENLIQVDHEESYVKVWGYVTNPTVYRSSRRHQSFYVNDRFVRSTELGRGVSEAYYNLLPKGRYPIAFLFIKINPVHVDVNVHPAKFEVKFSRPEIVSEVVSKGIKQALGEGEYLPEFKPIKKVQKKEAKDELELQTLFQDGHDPGSDSLEADKKGNGDTEEDSNQKVEGKDRLEGKKSDSGFGEVAKRIEERGYSAKNWDPSQKNTDNDRYNKKRPKKRKGNYDFDRAISSYEERQSSETPATSSTEEKSKIEKKVRKKSSTSFVSNLRPIGQIHKTYIIAEGNDGFYVLDQHVAHERILYEELMNKFRDNGLPSQQLLIPLTLELTLEEIQVIKENEDIFEQLGYTVENFGGNTVIVRAVPKRMDVRSDKDLFLEIVDLLLEEKKMDRARLYDRLITQFSCKGAIKAGEYLDEGEMNKLLRDLDQTHNPRYCPHGRPILFHITEKDLLKAFQRI